MLHLPGIGHTHEQSVDDVACQQQISNRCKALAAVGGGGRYLGCEVRPSRWHEPSRAVRQNEEEVEFALSARRLENTKAAALVGVGTAGYRDRVRKVFGMGSVSGGLSTGSITSG